MKIFKFGGASVSNIDRIKNTASILQSFHGQKLLVVVSAMGKTTNALEKVAESFYNGDNDNALRLFEVIKQNHLQTAKYLLVKNYNAALDELVNIFTEVEWLLHDKAVREFDYYYDQVVCAGELLSTVIISAYLNEEKIANQWVDVRDILRTDNNFRDANINWDYSQHKADTTIRDLFIKNDIIVTQGFIGSTAENESTTLGREGSDYTAAIFANLLNAESMVIWKDVEGVMNADPKEFPNAQVIKELDYKEVIEMAYYGAQVIHPKTIKPLGVKNIPLQVKCFLNPDLPGTIIYNKKTEALPSIIVVKQNQALLQLNSKDFSFVGEKAIRVLYGILEMHNIKPNITQNGAISFLCCIDDNGEKVSKLASEIAGQFDVNIIKGLTLLTIRHYTNELLLQLTMDKTILLQQQSRETVQVLMQ